MFTLAELVLDGWAGRTATTVEVVRSTPKRSLIRALTRTALGGRHRWIEADVVAVVPNTALRNLRAVEKLPSPAAHQEP